MEKNNALMSAIAKTLDMLSDSPGVFRLDVIDNLSETAEGVAKEYRVDADELEEIVSYVLLGGRLEDIIK